MKRIFLVFILLISGSGYLQAQQSPAVQLAQKIAQKMKDSLGLSEQQQGQVYDINMLLHNNKAAIRQQYSNADSVRHHLQLEENKRDPMYHAILSENIFQLYLQKKRNLLNNN